MQKTNAHLAEMKLVGITTRTNNATIFEQDPSTNPIAAIVKKYFHSGLSEKIINKKKPGTTFCAYTNFESDHTGNYTFFIGEEVTSFDNLAEGFECLTIPMQDYVKFTNTPGPMPSVCIDMWKNILSDSDFDKRRAYITDFEIYDERSRDHSNTVLDIFIGIKK